MDWYKRFTMILLVTIPLYKISQCFTKPYEPFSGDINVKLDLSSYATKADLKNVSFVDTSNFALKQIWQVQKTKLIN